MSFSKLRTWWSAPLPTDHWTLRHTMRYGRNPAKIIDDYERYLRNPEPKLARLGRIARRIFNTD